MKKIALIGIIVLLLSSCVAFDSAMKFNSNGSGNLVFKYRISQMLKSMGESQAGGEGGSESAAPFPISKEKVEESLKDIKGITVNSVKEWEDEQDIYVEVDLDFANAEALANAEMFEEMPITITQEGGKTKYTQLISIGEAATDAESLEMMKTYFEGYELLFKITAPGKILSNNRGKVSADLRTVTYEIALNDLMQISEKTELIITW